MNARRLVLVGLTMVAGAVPAAVVVAGHTTSNPGLPQQVQDATSDFRDVNNAIAAGYESLGSCVTGPEEGAMGVHYAKGALVGDGEIHADLPELLVYEQRNGRLRLVGVEYLVLVDDWVAKGNPSPPVLVGQHFQFVNSPNRYALPAFYELHVWAWKNNSKGTFVDWNPAVSCDEYTGEPGAHAGH
ncbi:MAG: hypothetical protein ACXWXV_13840 [Aeromicrobium sp.]